MPPSRAPIGAPTQPRSMSIAQQRSNRRFAPYPSPSVSRRSSYNNQDDELLDSWRAHSDSSHHQRVQLHRRRREVVTEHRERQRRFSSQTAERPSLPSQTVSRTNSSHNDVSHFSSRAGRRDSDGFRVPPRPSIESTTNRLNYSDRSASVPDLASLFQDQLNTYDEQIKSLQEGEWPAVPSPRSKARRLDGAAFSQDKAQQMKRWSVVEGYMYGRHSVSLRTTDIVYPRERYQVGMLLSAPHHTASAVDELWVPTDDPHNTATPFGVVHSKYRKMVVIRTFGEHCIYLPIYSHNGRGLDGKAFAAEYVSIRDVRDRAAEPAEGYHGCLFAAADSGFRGNFIVGKSCVRLSEFISHRYIVPMTIEGMLDEKSRSLKQLLDLVKFVGAF